MKAASNDPLFDDWLDAWIRDPLTEWSAWWTTVAARAKSLAEDSPECAAMIRAKLLRVHGPRGLKFRSLYQSDDAPETDAAEVEMRRQIERAVALGSCFIDASGCMSRSDFDWQMSWSACVYGDAFAIRVWQEIPGVPTATRWRQIHPARVCAPPDKVSDPKYVGGIEIDGNGRPAALWIETSATMMLGVQQPGNMQRIPWTAPDGTPNVVHLVGLRIPGSRRGLSDFAPIMLPARMLQGVTTAYVATKRVQASHPMLLHVDNVKAAREAYRGTRIENLLIAKDHSVEFPGWKFEGADYREFIDTTVRSLCAAWQIPWELVMGDHSAKSGASSRSLWQQHYQMADREQSDYANAVQRKVDESIVREINERNSLGLGDDWWANMQGIYQGPPKVMPDPQKEIMWAEGMRALGVSRSTILNRFGEDFRDEVMQDRQDAELADAQQPEQPEAEDASEPGEKPEDTPADDAEDAADGEPVEDAAPAAFMSMDGGIHTKPTHREQDMKPSEMKAMLSAFAEMQAAERKELMAMLANRAPQHPGHVIHTDMRAEAIKEVLALMPPPVINIPAQPAPVVHIAPTDVHVAAPSVTVQAADAPAPTVTVNVPAPVVNVANTVEVPQRPVRVTVDDAGNAIMEPVK